MKINKKNNWAKWFLIVNTLNFVFLYSLSTSLFISNETSLRFYCYIDGVLQNSSAAYHLRVMNITPGEHNVALIFPDYLEKPISFRVFCQTFMETQYLIKSIIPPQVEYGGKIDIRLMPRPSKEVTTVTFVQNINYITPPDVLYNGMVSNATLTFYTDTGEPFFVVLDGVLQNLKPANSVRINHVPDEIKKILVIFSGKGAKFLNTEIKYWQGYETVFKISYQGGRYKILLDKVFPMRGGNTFPVQISIEYKSEIESIPFDIDIYSGAMSQTQVNVTMPLGANPSHSQGVLQTATECNGFPKNSFQSFLNSLKNTTYDDTRVKVALSGIQDNTITATQLREVLQLFMYENNKLEVAKKSYDYVCDKNNFYIIYDVFSYDASKKELIEYVNSRK